MAFKGFMDLDAVREQKEKSKSKFSELKEKLFSFKLKKRTESHSASDTSAADRFKVRNGRKSIKHMIFYVGTTVFVSVLFVVLFIAIFFQVNTITVEGNDFYTAEKIIESCGFKGMPNMFTVNDSAAEKMIMSENPYVNHVKITRNFPSELIITVNEEAPTYYVELGGEYYLLSSTLRVVKRCQTKAELLREAPHIIGLTTPKIKTAIVGSQVEFVRDSNFDFLYDLLTKLNKTVFSDDINYIDASDKYHIDMILFSGRYMINLGDSDNVAAKIDFVKAVMDKSFNENSMASINVEYLDSAIVTLKSSLFQW